MEQVGICFTRSLAPPGPVFGFELTNLNFDRNWSWPKNRPKMQNSLVRLRSTFKSSDTDLNWLQTFCAFLWQRRRRTEKERCKNLVTERFVHITADIGFWSCHPKILVTKIKIQLRKSLSSLELLSVILRHEGFWKSQQLVRVIGAQALSRVCNNGYVMAGQV